MENIKSSKNSFGYNCYLIETDNGSFEISFQNNLDLYWKCNHEGSILDCPDSYEFLITKENYYLYSLFYRLYESIEQQKPFLGMSGKYDSSYYYFNNASLFKDGVIKWISDDGYDNDGCFVSIQKLDDDFKVIFNKGLVESNYLTYSVRIRTSGSRYDNYFIPFMRMYKDLEKYDEIKDQIHIEEYMYRVRKKEK